MQFLSRYIDFLKHTIHCIFTLHLEITQNVCNVCKQFLRFNPTSLSFAYKFDMIPVTTFQNVFLSQIKLQIFIEYVTFDPDVVYNSKVPLRLYL